jgi:hypothetical protein
VVVLELGEKDTTRPVAVASDIAPGAAELGFALAAPGNRAPEAEHPPDSMGQTCASRPKALDWPGWDPAQTPAAIRPARRSTLKLRSVSLVIS